MNKLLAGIALAMAIVVASDAFAIPFCPGETWKDGQLVCVSLDDNQ
jgi:hypothetical protein